MTGGKYAAAGERAKCCRNLAMIETELRVVNGTETVFCETVGNLNSVAIVNDETAPILRQSSPFAAVPVNPVDLSGMSGHFPGGSVAELRDGG